MLTRKQIENVRRLMDQTPEPPEHERGQSVLADRNIKEGTDVIRLSLGYVLLPSGDVNIMSRDEQLPEGASWLEERK